MYYNGKLHNEDKKSVREKLNSHEAGGKSHKNPEKKAGPIN